MLVQSECNMDDPEQFAAWAFAAGVPDPRGERYPNQPLIPAKCFPALSKMLWDFGFRFDPEKQTKWVGQRSGPTRNFEAWGTTDIKPEDIMGDLAQMAAEEFPEVAAKVAAVTPENHKEAFEAQAKELLSALDRLKAANELMNEQMAGARGEADGGST